MSKKILVNVWTPLIETINSRCASACLRRDAYLDKVLGHEAEALAREVDGRNSDDARSYIAKHLAQVPKKQLNLVLEAETVERIDSVCLEKNVPRDAFVNRILLLLVTETEFYKRLVAPDFSWDEAHRLLMEEGGGPEEKYYLFGGNHPGIVSDVVNMDPFWYMRALIEWAQQEDQTIPDLHAACFKEDALKGLLLSAIGFNVHLSDDELKGHPAQLAREDEARRLLAKLFGEKTPPVAEDEA